MGSYVGFNGGYLGVIPKLGPFCSRDNCSLVRGGFGQVDYPFVGTVCACMADAGGWEPRCWVGICCAAGRCGAMGVAGNVVGLEVVVEVLEILDGTFQCPLKVFWWLMSIFTACLFRL